MLGESNTVAMLEHVLETKSTVSIVDSTHPMCVCYSELEQ